MVKTKKQLEEQIRVDELFVQHRKESDQIYAPIIVKVIVFGMVACILLTALGALLSQIIVK